MKKVFVIWAALLVLPCITTAGTLPDAGQTKCYDNTQEITCPNPGEVDGMGVGPRYRIEMVKLLP